MIGNLPAILWMGFTALIVCQVSNTSEVPEANLPDVSEDTNFLCKLTKTCTTLGNKLRDYENDFRAKQRICQLADQASLLPDETKCDEKVLFVELDLSLDDIASPTTDDVELAESLCDLSTICVMLALTPHAQDPDHEPMKIICKLADGKMKTKGNFTCKPIEPEDSLSEEDSGIESGEEPLENQDDQPQILTSRTHRFDDCLEIYAAQDLYSTPRTGVYAIRPANSGTFTVYCDMTTDGGGWTVIQRRYSGDLDFNRPYNAYRYGFGSKGSEHWLGLEYIGLITAQNNYQLYVELVDWSNNIRYAKYSSFRVIPWWIYSNLLIVGGYSGNAGDSLSYSNGAWFSARDRDHDTWTSGNCAGTRADVTGGWWYKSCSHSALNGPYLRPSDRTGHSGRGIFWSTFSPSTYSYYLKKSKMMIRPADFHAGK